MDVCCYPRKTSSDDTSRGTAQFSNCGPRETSRKTFVLKLEFRATPNADSGVFIRGKQLQCRDYALAGPYKQLANYRPQQWNELEIRVTGNVAKCTCNGELLEEAFSIPASGPIGLEGDRGQMEYRNIRIQVKP